MRNVTLNGEIITDARKSVHDYIRSPKIIAKKSVFKSFITNGHCAVTTLEREKLISFLMDLHSVQ